jgi:hypothetical protein
MKRKREEPSELLLILPDELWIEIIAEAHHTVPHIATVSKRWMCLIQNYKGWFERASRYYRNMEACYFQCQKYFGEFADDNEMSSVAEPETEILLMTINNIFSILEEGIDCGEPKEINNLKYLAFRNYIGFLMNSKIAKIREVLYESINEYWLEFRWPIIDSINRYLTSIAKNYLAMGNFHPRDVYLNFREEDHCYILVIRDSNGLVRKVVSVPQEVDDDDGNPLYNTTVCGNIGGTKPKSKAHLRSNTTFIHDLFPVFDADEAISKMKANVKKWNNPEQNKYFGMSDEEIKNLWIKNNGEASHLGTDMHANLECYCINLPYESESREFELFKQFEVAHVKDKLRPYRAEWTLYNEFLQMCGSGDIFYEYIVEPKREPGDKRKHLVLMDWKRSKEIKKDNVYESGLIPCLAHAPNCNYIHFSIQLPLYKIMAEAEYNVVIDSMFIVALHPNQKTYLIEEVKWSLVKPFILDILRYRIETLGKSKEEGEQFLTPWL